MSELTLKINNQSYSGWESVHIHRSMSEITGAFAVSIDNFFKGGTDFTEIKIGQQVVIEIDGSQVLDGWIDRMPIKYGKDFSRMDIFGRDNTCDLVDCSFDTTPNEWKLQTVENIIKNLCNPFGISVAVDITARAESLTVIDNFKATEGMPVYELISELCRDNSIMPLNLGDGVLTLTKSASTRFAFDTISVGENAVAGYLNQSNEDRFSSYKVKGQGIGNDNKGLTDFVTCEGIFSDSVITRERPMVIFSETPSTQGQCIQRAKWEAKVRAGYSRSIQFELPEWVQSSGQPWEINQLVRVSDEFSGIEDQMLIAAVDFIYDTSDITRILCVDTNTFSNSDDPITIKTGFDI
jgi:prophage tail gpP-like protein